MLSSTNGVETNTFANNKAVAEASVVQIDYKISTSYV